MSRRRRYLTALRETLEWRLISLTIEFVLFWMLTGMPDRAMGFVSVSFLVKTISFYVWRLARAPK